MHKDINRPFNTNKKKSCTSHSVFNSLENIPHAVHLKDAQTKKYILCNQCCAKLMGIGSANALIGLTSDYFSEEGGIWWKWNFSISFNNWLAKQNKFIRALEVKVQTTRSPVIGHESLHFTPEGFILVEKLLKQPILNKYGKRTIAILSTRLDLTPQRSLFELLDLYLKFYTEKSALQRLFKYLAVDVYFIKLPTLFETRLLFALHQQKNIKTLADYLACSNEQINYYIECIQEKLNSLNLNTILQYLSKYKQVY